MSDLQESEAITLKNIKQKLCVDTMSRFMKHHHYQFHFLLPHKTLNIVNKNSENKTI